MLYKNTLLALDFSDKKIIQQAKKISDAYKAKFNIIYVVENLPSIAYGYIGTADLEEKLVEEGQIRLNKLAKELKLPTKQVHLSVGQAKTEILALAKKIKADLIFLGSHGHSGLDTLLGSTTNSVVNNAHCDVLVLRSKHK